MVIMVLAMLRREKRCEGKEKWGFGIERRCKGKATKALLGVGIVKKGMETYRHSAIKYRYGIVPILMALAK